MGKEPKARPVGRPSSYKPEYCAQVVEAMRAGFSLTAFAGMIGVARSTINEWMEGFPEFSEAVSRAKAARLLHWEEAAIGIAKTGAGPGAATVVIFGLKNMAPDEYSDRQEIRHSGSISRPAIEMTDEEIDQRLAELRARGGGSSR